MALNWINVEDYSFNSFLLMERFQIRYICSKACDWGELKYNLAVALRHNPAVRWYFAHRCPECAPVVDEIMAAASVEPSCEEIRSAEVFMMGAFEDFVVYSNPDIMDASCDFICNWDKQRLYELADLTDKVVLDVGSGSGRLAFAAAEKAKIVVASEPVGMLREYMRDKIAREGIRNVMVADGMVDKIPYPDSIFDIVMSGHVVGDDLDGEIAELSRVVKSGGWILDCPGDGNDKRQLHQGLIARGWESFFHVTKSGGEIYRYRKQVFK